MAVRSPKHGLTRGDKAWVKSIGGKTKRICSAKLDADEADRVYEQRMTELWAGIAIASPSPVEDAKLKELFDQWTFIRRSGGMNESTLASYERVIQQFLDELPTDIRYNELTPFLFSTIHAKWKNKYATAQLFKRVTIVRMAFRWLAANDFISAMPKMGDFKQPKTKELKVSATQRELRDGAQVFTPAELAAMLAAADPMMRALILLGINGGYGNTDLSELPVSVVDMDKGWIDYARNKTGNKRRVPLWPETIDAVKKVMPMSLRPGYVFSTQPGKRGAGGLPLVRQTGRGVDNRISVMFGNVADAAGCHRKGLAFYGLRRTFATAAAMHGPTLFVKRITGHNADAEDRIIDNHYITGDVDRMLVKIVDGVRQHLLSETRLARLATPLPAASALAAAEKKSRRRGKTRSKTEGTSSPGPDDAPSRGRHFATAAA